MSLLSVKSDAVLAYQPPFNLAGTALLRGWLISVVVCLLFRSPYSIIIDSVCNPDCAELCALPAHSAQSECVYAACHGMFRPIYCIPIVSPRGLHVPHACNHCARTGCILTLI